MAAAGLNRLITSLITSPRVRTAQRRFAAARRRLRGAMPTVHYFHQPGDPYSQLAAQAVPLLRARTAIELRTHTVSPPDEAAAPDAPRLAAYAQRDAAILARATGFSWPAPAFDAGPNGDALRAQLGHYSGAMFAFEGEWYWGLDRLAYLEERLAEFRKPGAPDALIAPRREVTLAPLQKPARAPRFDAFISFRSPYTYLAMARTYALADHYAAELRLRFVLPMVMRGLPVPMPKRLYIVRDAKREAERLGLPFGRIVDPVGVATERGLSILHRAIPEGLGRAFALSFLKGVFADGIDAASEAGLGEIARRAGVSESLMRAGLSDASWRDVAEANRTEMLGLGVWGVPSFRVDDGPALWGQDRLFAIEDMLRRAAQGEAA